MLSNNSLRRVVRATARRDTRPSFLRCCFARARRCGCLALGARRCQHPLRRRRGRPGPRRPAAILVPVELSALHLQLIAGRRSCSWQSQSTCASRRHSSPVTTCSCNRPARCLSSPPAAAKRSQPVPRCCSSRRYSSSGWRIPVILKAQGAFKPS